MNKPGWKKQEYLPNGGLKKSSVISLQLKAMESIGQCFEANLWPGYPYSKIIIIDGLTEEAYMDGFYYKDYHQVLKEFGSEVAYHGIEHSLVDKNGWVYGSIKHNPDLSKLVLKSGDDACKIDNGKIVNLWVALNVEVHDMAAQRIRDKDEGVIPTRKIIFCYMDGDSEYTVIKTLDNPTVVDAQRFANQFNTGDPDTPWVSGEEED